MDAVFGDGRFGDEGDKISAPAADRTTLTSVPLVSRTGYLVR